MNPRDLANGNAVLLGQDTSVATQMTMATH